MGEFTELTLSFHLREDTPPDVLSTLAPLRRADQDSPWAGPAPDLRPFEPVPGDGWWEFDWREANGPDHVDPLAAEPWRHNWAPSLSGSMSVGTVATAALVWSELKLWHFSCRCSFKTWPQAVLESVSWLAPFIKTFRDPNHPAPDLVGMMTYDGSLRPYLAWCQHGQLTLENLNRPGEEY